MGGSKENTPCFIEGASNFQDDVRVRGAKQMELAQNHRRALAFINQNIMGANLHSIAINKKGLSGIDVALKPNQGLTQAVISNPEETKDDTVVDVDDCEDDDGISIPMFVRHTEAFLDEIDRMEVDEMEDPEDHIADIHDSNDLQDPLAVVDYVDDIYTYYRKTEESLE